MRCVAAVLFFAGAGLFWEPAAPAQQITTLDQLPRPVASGFVDGQNHAPLPCKLSPVRPVLNFDYRFQTGYTFETSLDPSLDGYHHWDIVFRVTPENNARPPVYFLDSLDPRARSAGYSAEYFRQAKDATASNGA